MNKRTIAIILLVVIGFTIYANTFANPFIWDDFGLVVDNKYIKDFKFLPNIFSEHLYSGVDYPSNFYRPFQSLSYLIDHSLFKLNPAGFHFTNTLLHVINSILVLGLIFLLSKNLFISFITSVLFIVHPVHTEAVTYIAGRADLLLALFSLSCVLAFLKYIFTKKKILYYLSLLAFICALLSKEVAVILPGVLILCQYTFSNHGLKSKLKTIAPFLAVCVIYVSLRLTVLNFATHSVFYFPFALGVRMLTFFKAIVIYLRLIVFPVGLHMQYKLEPCFSVFSPVAMLGIIIIIMFIFSLIYTAKKNKLIHFALLWFIIWLIPQTNIFPINASIAEHFLYLPSVGLFLILGLFTKRLINDKSRIFIQLLIAVLVFSFAVITVRQNTRWNDPVKFYEYNLKFSPDNFLIMRSLASVYNQQGETDKAIKLYEKSIESAARWKLDYFNTSIALSYANLAGIYEENKESDLAVDYYNKALEFMPDSHSLYLQIAGIYNDNGDYKNALSVLNKGIVNLKGKDTEFIYFEIARIYERLNELDKAMDHYEKAIAVNSEFSAAYNRLGFMYDLRNDDNLAIANYKKALILDPNDAFLYNNLGIFFAKRGNFKQAEISFKKAIELADENAEFYYNLGAMYAESNNYLKARQMLKNVLELDKDFKKAKIILDKIEGE